MAYILHHNPDYDVKRQSPDQSMEMACPDDDGVVGMMAQLGSDGGGFMVLPLLV